METFEGRFPFLFNKQADYNTNSPSYYDGLAKYNTVLKILAKMIEEYDEKLDNSLENINTVLTNYTTMLDGKLAGFDNSVMLLLREWIDDGTFEMIINTEIFNHKLDTSEFDAFVIANDLEHAKLPPVNLKVDTLGIAITTTGAIGDWNGSTGTDNTVAIQKAFNDIPEGGTVIIPPGKFLTKALTIPKKCRVIGFGTLVYDFDTASGALLTAQADGTLIDGVNFDAKGTVGNFAYKAYIYTLKSNVKVSNCSFKNGMQGTHFDTWTSKHCKVTNCYAESMLGSGFLALGSNYTLISGNTAISCGDGAISLFNAFNCKVTDNTVYNSDQAITIDAGSRSNVVSGNTVMGNKAGTDSHSGYYGIDLKNDSHDNVIIGNTVSGVVVGITARFGDAGVGLQAICSNNIIEGNNITECSAKGFASNPGGILIEGQSGLIVRGNTISRTLGIAINAFAGGSSNRDLIIEGNFINLHGVNYGSLSYMAVNFTSIKISGFAGVLISGNTIQHAPEEMTAKAIVISGSSSVQIHDNTLKALTAFAIELSGATTATIKNNVFESWKKSLNVILLLDTTTEIIISGNIVEGQIGYFIMGEACPYYAENNKYYSTYSDALGGTGAKRIFNNDGFGGGKMRFNAGKIEVWDGGAWIVVGTQV